MLADGSEYTYEEEINAAYGIVPQDTKQVCEWLNSRFRVVDKLHQDVILGFDWFQSVNLQVAQLNYGVTLKNGFVAAGVPVHCNVKVKLCSFKALLHYFHANKVANNLFTFFSMHLVPRG